MDNLYTQDQAVNKMWFMLSVSADTNWAMNMYKHTVNLDSIKHNQFFFKISNFQKTVLVTELSIHKGCFSV